MCALGRKTLLHAQGADVNQLYSAGVKLQGFFSLQSLIWSRLDNLEKRRFKAFI